MVKTILAVLSVMLIASDAQLSNVSKRFRNREAIDFGRDAATIVRKSSRGEGQKRILEAKAVDASMSMAAESDLTVFEFDFSMSMSEELSLSVPAEESMSMIAEVEEEEETEVAVEEETPADSSPLTTIGCNGDEYCPADMKCQCWLFCRFCFFPPCGTCVPN